MLVALSSTAHRDGTDVGAAIGHAITGALTLEALVLAATRIRWDRHPDPAEPHRPARTG